MLDDPRVNFAISTRGRQPGSNHLGIQAEDKAELKEIYGRLHQSGGTVIEQGETQCCYARSEKSWIDDPAGISWETFLTTGESTDYGDGSGERDARVAHSQACLRAEGGSGSGGSQQPNCVGTCRGRSSVQRCCFFAPAIPPARSWRKRS